jgi:RNA polymerase sigma-70 factor (ECF subfamily)
VLLRDVEGLSHLQIADVLGVSVPTVKSRVHRARLLLRKQLGAALTTSDATTAARSDA